MSTVIPYLDAVQSVIELSTFLRAADRLGLTEDERAEIVDLVAETPSAGDEMRGTGGCRKLRVARPGGGKSGGYRVITFFSGERMPVFLITVYAKGAKDNLTADERKTLAGLSRDIRQSYGERGGDL